MGGTISYEVLSTGKSLELRFGRDVKFLGTALASMEFGADASVVYVGQGDDHVADMVRSKAASVIVMDPLKLVVFSAEMEKGLIVLTGGNCEVFKVTSDAGAVSLRALEAVGYDSKVGKLLRVLHESEHLELKTQVRGGASGARRDEEEEEEEDVVVVWARPRSSDGVRQALFDLDEKCGELAVRVFDTGTVVHEAHRCVQYLGESGKPCWQRQRDEFSAWLKAIGPELGEALEQFIPRDSDTTGSLQASFKALEANGLLGSLPQLPREHQIASLQLAFGHGVWARKLRLRLAEYSDDLASFPVWVEKGLEEMLRTLPFWTWYHLYPREVLQDEVQLWNSCFAHAASRMITGMVAVGNALVLGGLPALLDALEELGSMKIERVDGSLSTDESMREQCTLVLRCGRAFVHSLQRTTVVDPEVIDAGTVSGHLDKFETEFMGRFAADLTFTTKPSVEARDALLEYVRRAAGRSGNFVESTSLKRPGRLAGMRIGIAELRTRLAALLARGNWREQLLAGRVTAELEKLVGCIGTPRQLEGVLFHQTTIAWQMRGLNVVSVPVMNVRGIVKRMGREVQWNVLLADTGGPAVSLGQQLLLAGEAEGARPYISEVKDLTPAKLESIDLGSSGPWMAVFDPTLPEELALSPPREVKWRLATYMGEVRVWKADGGERKFSATEATGGPTGHATNVVCVSGEGDGLTLHLQQAGKKQFVEVLATEVQRVGGKIYTGVGVEATLRVPVPESLVPPCDGAYQAQALVGHESGQVGEDEDEEVQAGRRRLEYLVPWPGETV